ncbi:MAG TPA: c-type cytochrome [Fluviicoccus sp.]|nr:c-type cytochrome [Fluviicoccus sp.]
MKKSLAALVAGLVVGLAHAAPMPKGDPAAGQMMAAQCAACHGADGNSAAPTFPRLAGQGERYLAKQLMDFRDGRRINALMQPMAMGKTDQDIANLAAYFASQKAGVNLADPATIAAGEHLYRGGDAKRGVTPCAGCHGPAGRGNSLAGFPKLGGQHADYVKAQLIAFRAAGRDDNVPAEQKRVNDAAKAGELGIMQMVAAKLSDKDIEKLANYVSGLH